MKPGLDALQQQIEDALAQNPDLSVREAMATIPIVIVDAPASEVESELGRINATIKPHLTLKNIEEGAYTKALKAMFDTYVQMGAATTYVDEFGVTHYRTLRDVTPEEQVEVDRAVDAALQQ